MTRNNKTPEQQDLVELLPWHAAGTLSERDAGHVEDALARDPELARQYELAREELIETIHVNETLGVPSVRAAERLFAAIDAEPGIRGGSRPPNLAVRVRAFLSSLSPRTLAWTAGAAAIAILLQAGVIATMLFGEHGSSVFQTASYEDRLPSGGPSVLVRFAPQASAAEITAFLESYKASVIAGPMAGGLFRLRVPVSAPAKEELARIAAQMQQSKIVGFAAPSD